MSITKEDGVWIIYCDVCQNPDYKTFDEWDEAVDHKIDGGWKSKKEGGGWIDVCPDCQK